MTDPQPTIPSPCVKNCCLNEDDICLGCFRSMDEICRWSESDNQTKVMILNNAEQRRLESSHHKLTDTD